MKLNVLFLPGDGIGAEVTSEAVKVLQQVASQFGHDAHAERRSAGRHRHPKDRRLPSRRRLASSRSKPMPP